jgi:hypothetical protein
MANMKEEAQAYQPKQTKNIAELDKVPVNLEVEDRVYKQGTPDEYKSKVVVVEGVDYKVPNIVLGQLKEQLEENPDLPFFKVKKTGAGQLDTRYTVIPVMK